LYSVGPSEVDVWLEFEVVLACVGVEVVPDCYDSG